MRNTVRAKFKVTAVTRREHWDKQKGDLVTVELSPVMASNPENEAFYAATPSGAIRLDTLNQAAGESFKLGAEYFVDFTPAE